MDTGARGRMADLPSADAGGDAGAQSVVHDHSPFSHGGGVRAAKSRLSRLSVDVAAAEAAADSLDAIEKGESKDVLSDACAR